MKNCRDIILEYVKGKDVLDIGSCGNQDNHDKTGIKPKTLYKLIKEKAKSVTGVDIESDNNEIIKGNAETIKLNKKFDIIIAGDVIEHLHNVGLFLDNMRRHLKENGLMIITTPNLKSILPLVYNEKYCHTFWFCKHTIRYLVENHNFKVEKIIKSIRYKRNPIIDLLRYFITNHLLVICKPNKK